MKGSGAPQLGRVIPSASNPTFVDSIHSAWDAATPEERRSLEKQPGLVGRIAKERAGSLAASQEIADQSPANEGLVDSPQQLDNNGSLNRQLGGGLPDDSEGLTPEQIAQGQRAGLASDRDRRRLQIEAMRKGLSIAPEGDAPDGITGIVGNAMGRNYHTTNAMIGGLGAAASKAVGADDLSLWFAKQYFDETAKAKGNKAHNWFGSQG